MTMKGSVVLLSAGLDSTVNFAAALSEIGVNLALTIDYGQTAAPMEIMFSKLIAESYGMRHISLETKWIADFTGGGLVSGEVPKPDIENLTEEMAVESARAVWVPNRNGVFVNIAAGIAEGLGAEYVVAGFNAEEAATFPDNSEEFVTAANESLSFSTLSKVKIKSFTQKMTKKEIVRYGEKLGIPWDLIWVCYLGGPKMCGVCESCQRLKRALQFSGLEERFEGRFVEV